MADQSACPETARLQALLDGTLSEDQQASLASHLVDCETCRTSFEKLTDRVGLLSQAAKEKIRQQTEPDDALQNMIAELRAEGPRTQDARDEPTGRTTAGPQPTTPDLSLEFLKPSDDPKYLGKLDSYEILEVIGRGGMGVVLKGLDPRLNRCVAIKVLAPQLASTGTARRRFLREARAAAAVSHDHIVTIHAIDETEGMPYIVMECVLGVSLADRIRRTGPLELQEILRIGMQTAGGLAAAHAQGLVHRDVKPANILLENGVERVKITDFGLARAADDAQITQSGVVAGTPEYMSPEQTRGQTVDHRSDLFSLGCVLYAMCTGRSPFRASKIVDASRRVCDDAPRPIREVNSAIPEWLVEIIDRLLAKDANDRFQSASEVAELLGAHLAHLQRPAEVPKPATPPTATPRSKQEEAPRPRRIRWGVATAILLLIGVLILTESTGRTRFSTSIVRFLPRDNVASPEPVRPPPPAPPPPVNWALRFDGVDDYVIIPLHYDGTHPITIEAWVIPESENPFFTPRVPLMREMFSSIVADTAASGINLGIDERGFFFGAHDGQNYQAVSSTQFPFGRGRIHLAGTFDGTTFRLFVNGELANESPFSGKINPSRLSLMIGANPQPGIVSHFHFKGIIEEVRISNVVRHTEDFAAEGRLEPDEATLALYHFDEGEGQRVLDGSGNDQHGRIQGAQWVDLNRLDDLRDPDKQLPDPFDPFEDLSPVVNLLPLVNADRDALNPLYGRWSFEQRSLCISGMWPFLQIPYLPPEEYELAVTVERISIDKPFGIGLNLGGKTCFVRLDWRSKSECQSDLATWNGESYETLGEASSEQILRCGEPVTICCRVAGTGHQRRVDVACNGRDAFRWEGNIEEILGQAPFQFLPKDERALTLCGFGGTFRITDVRLHPVSGEGQPVFSGGSAPAHRQLAEHLLWAGGAVEVSDERDRSICVERVDELPAKFVLRGIDSTGSFPLSDIGCGNMEGLETLQSVILRGQRALPVDQLQRLLQGPLLTEVDFANTSITDEHLKGVANLSGLTKVDLSFTPITDAGLVQLKGCQALRSLALASTGISDEGLTHLADLEHLEELSLCGTHVGDEGVQHLKSLAGLKRLTLDHLPIGDAALDHLGDLSELTYLSLLHTQVSDAGMASLAKLKSLREVCLVGAAVTRNGVDSLKRSLPECRVLHGLSESENLLALIDADRDTVRGTWTARPNVLHLDKEWKGTHARVQIPFSPPENYVLRAVARRESGKNMLKFGVVVGGHQTGVAVDNYQQKGCLTGLESVDGRRPRENETASSGQVFHRGAAPTTILITVRGSHITVACAGEVRIDWEGDSSRLSVHGPYVVPNKDQLFVATYSDSFTISELELIPISTGDAVSTEAQP